MRAGGQDKGRFTLAQLREAVDQTALSDAVPVRLDGSDTEEPLADLLRRTRKPAKVVAPADTAHDAHQRRTGSEWSTALLILSLIVAAPKPLLATSR